MWLAAQGRNEEAQEIVRRYVGEEVQPPPALVTPPRDRRHLAELMSAPWSRRTLVACTYFTTSVIPYFAIGTFVAGLATCTPISRETSVKRPSPSLRYT